MSQPYQVAVTLAEIYRFFPRNMYKYDGHNEEIDNSVA